MTVRAIELPCYGAGFRNDGKPAVAVSSAISMIASVPAGLRRLCPIIVQTETAVHPSEDEGGGKLPDSKRVYFTKSQYSCAGFVAPATRRRTERKFRMRCAGADGGRDRFENHKLTHDILRLERYTSCHIISR